jgi:hypothetical protein
MISPSVEAQPYARCERDARLASHRLARRKLRVFTFISDLLLINLAFVLGYVARYRWQLFRDIAFDASLADYWPI